MDNTITNCKALLSIAKRIAFYKAIHFIRPTELVDLLKRMLRLMHLKGRKLLIFR